MKAIRALKIVLKDTIFSREREYLKECISELEALKERILYLESIETDLIKKDNKAIFKDYTFTNCNDCINKVDNKFTSACFGCKRYYSCRFKLKKDK